jgi:hypothetical protein
VRYCPNPQCPYRGNHDEPAEYRDHLVRCGDCGEELVDFEEQAFALTAITYALAPATGGRYLIFTGPMLYGLYRLVFRPRS